MNLKYVGYESVPKTMLVKIKPGLIFTNTAFFSKIGFRGDYKIARKK